MKMNPTHKWLLSLAVAVLTACSACGDDKEPEPEPNPNPQPTAKFTLAVDKDKLPVLQGSSGTITVTVTRETGFTGAVALALSGLPTGATATSATVASDAQKADITISAPGTAPHSLPTTVTVTGTSGDTSATKTLAVTVRGPAGSVDTSFASGKVITSVGQSEDYAEAIAVQSDGKVIVVGRSAGAANTDYAVVRYNRDGDLDTGFGTGGKVTTPINAGSDEAYAVAVQSDGKILVAGTTEAGASGYDFALVRYNTNGSLDTAFGTGGKVTTAFGNGPDKAYAIAVQPDGKILLGGEASFTATGLDFALARYNADGTLDTGFGTGGKVTTSLKPDTGRDVVFSLALQTVSGQSRIVAVGGDGDFLLAGYTSAGALDTAFGTGGKVVGVFGTVIGSARSSALTSDGKLVVAGDANGGFALARMNADGTLDTSFGTSGKVVTQVNAGNEATATALAIQSDGKLVAGGWTYTGGSSAGDFAVLRYDASGTLDTAFGTGGKVTTAMASGTKSDQAKAVALQPDDRVPVTRILLAGSANESNNEFAVTRYWP
ncbi:delta-60 repeat domain-containing protein [Hyalangium minutum]|uniref:Uncharacterized protein n=1 Tax=Hyalangium minutum TaxID=394096 RepID=A0A085WEX3_9BACT|nr:delta-60 repeat domain-containing protein [Hyalangium minutum]KFE66236.1 hypothetical protein DB31_1301 [Hyalangium minutum]